MASNQKFLSLNNEAEGENYYFPSEDNDPNRLSSDKEILPDELSDDQGEGHGHGKEAPKASLFGSAMNIANTIMGAGILALPNVIKQFGVIVGSAIISVSCILTFVSCILLLKSKNLSQHSKYISIGKHCFGNAGLWIVKLIIIVNNIGLCIAYLIIFTTVGSNLLKGFVQECKEGSGALYCQPWILTLLASVIVSPFVFAKSMAKLQGASAIAVLAASIFSIITIENFFEAVFKGTNPSDINILPHIEKIPKALASVTSVFLAFTFQFNFFPVYKTLRNPTDKRMKGTTSLGLSIVLFIYLSVANCGYLTFGKNGQDGFLDNFSKDSVGLPKFIIVNIAFLISSTLTFPLMFFGAKNETYGAIKLIRKKLDSRKVDSDATRSAEDDEKAIEEKYGFKGYRYNLYILVLFAMIVILAIKVPGINTVFEFVGSTAANGLNFLLPALFYLNLSSKRGKMRTIAMIMTVLGAVMGVVGIVSSALTL